MKTRAVPARHARRPSHRLLAVLIATALASPGIAAAGSATSDGANDDAAPATDTAPATATTTEPDGSRVTELGGVEVTGVNGRSSGGTGALGDRSVLDTPFSITSIGAEEIQMRQADTVGALFMVDASVGSTGTAYTGFPSALQIRGLPADNYDSLRLNGTPAGFIYGINLPMEFMDQVQLLKGATGFMYGFAAPGGMVNYVTKQAGDEVLSVDAGFRSEGVFSQHVDVGGAIAADGKLDYRVNLSNEQGETSSGNDIDRLGGALALRSGVTDDLVWTADVMVQRRVLDDPSPYFFVFPGTYAGDRLPVARTGDFNMASETGLIYNKFEYYATGLDWRISDDWRLKVEGSRMHSYLLALEDFTYLMNQAGDLRTSTWNGLDITDTEFGQAMLQGGFDTGPLSHDVVVGVSWQEQDMRLGHMNYAQTESVILNHNLYAPQTIVWDEDPRRNVYRSYTATQKTLFASDTVEFLDRWSVLAGVRYSEYTRLANSSRTLGSDGFFDMVYSEYTKYTLSPTYALIFKPVEQVTLYASYVESMEPGTTVGSTYRNYGDVLDPLESSQIEVGAKWQEGRWDASVAAFRIDRGAGYATGDNFYVQDGVIRYDGLELDGGLWVGSGLRLGGSVLWLDSAYENTSDPWLIGKAQAGSREFQASLDATWHLQSVPGLTLHAVGKYFGTGVASNNTALDTVVHAQPYALFNAGASYGTRIADRPVTFRAGVDNLFDRAYWSPAGSYVFLGAPRTYAVNVKVDF